MSYYRDGDLDNCEPLTAEEELRLFREYRAGSMAARDAIIRSQLRWAAKLATQIAPRWMSNDEAVSAANVGLLEAIEKFDPSHGTRLSTFMRKIILGAVCSDVRAHNVVSRQSGEPPHSVSFEHLDPEELSPEVDLEETPDAGQTEFSDLMKIVLRKAIRRKAITPLERHVLREHYFRGKKYGDIGAEMPPSIGKRVSRQRIEQIHKGAILKLRGLIKQYGLEWIRPTPLGE